MIKKSTIQLLRFQFSLFLMPVYWFALSFTDSVNIFNALLIFFILHFLVYPSSNGYNSYMDQDSFSIGGIKHPPLAQKQVFYVTIIMDGIALILAMIISLPFMGMLLLYIICSRLYSYRGIRLKKYPILGYLTVILNQGGLVFLMIYSGTNQHNFQGFSYIGFITSCLLIGGFYPITQIYQHDSDRSDHVTTLSMILGKRGTFIFCGLMYTLAFFFLFLYFNIQEQLWLFGIIQIFFLPVIVYFLIWASHVWKDAEKADFEHTMKMNWLASTCTSLAFITLIIFKYFD